MVGGDADVGGAVVHELQDRAQDTAHSGNLFAVGIAMGRSAEEMPKQLVGAVDEMDLHVGPESVTGTPASARALRRKDRSASLSVSSSAASYSALACSTRPSRRRKSARTACSK